MLSVSAIQRHWAEQGLHVSRMNVTRAIEAWCRLQRDNELPADWQATGNKADGALRMLQDIGKPGHANRFLKKHRPEDPHGNDNSFWGSESMASYRPAYKKARHAWEVMKSKDVGFRRTFANFGMFFMSLGEPPEYDSGQHRLAIGKKNPNIPWDKTNVRYILVSKEEERTTKEKKVQVRQRAYSAWRRTPQGTWPSFEAFLHDIGYPPEEGRWAVAPLDRNRELGPHNAGWVSADAAGKEILPLVVLSEKHCVKIAERIHEMDPLITKARAWDIATMLRNSRFIDREEEVVEPGTAATGTKAEQDQGQPPAPTSQGACASASPGSGVGGDLASALSFLATAVGSEDPSVRSAVGFVIGLEEAWVFPSESLAILEKYRAAIRAARQM